MEVHAHTHTARKKWTHYLWEFLMLFLAVFCGFLAENIREHAVEKVRAKQYAKSLVNDLIEDTVMIKWIIQQANNEFKLTIRLTDYLRNKPIEQIKNIDLFATNIDIYRPYTWNRTTLEQIKNSGSIRYFTNDSIIYRLSAYDASTRHMDEDYAGDQERLNKVVDLRNQVCNQNYPAEFRKIVFSTRHRLLDSLMKTDTYIEIGKNGPGLLTNNIHAIEIYANEIIGIGERLRTRSETELPELLQGAKKLIFFLKKEYHLK
jgi:hypothetical protein